MGSGRLVCGCCKGSRDVVAGDVAGSLDGRGRKWEDERESVDGPQREGGMTAGQKRSKSRRARWGGEELEEIERSR